MGLLDGDIQSLFGGVFSQLYLDGAIYAPMTYTDDGQGGLTASEPTATPCKLQIDACTERQKLEQGYSARDVRILVLQSGLGARPSPGSRIAAKGVLYTIGPVVTEDPASSYFEIRGTP